VKWLPIESAPACEAVLLWVPEVGMFTGMYYDGGWMAFAPFDLIRLDYVPTHWMPLPEPPNAELERTP
jgi:hypothetical protein